MKVIVSRDISHSRYGSRIGACDHAMAYAVGLSQLGHEVYFMEDVSPDACRDAEGDRLAFAEWRGRSRFRGVLEQYGIWPRGCLIFDGGREAYGMDFRRAVTIAGQADLLINVQGRLTTPEILEAVACRIYIDINPAKTQVYQSEYGIDRGFDRHDHFFTVGLNIGTERSPIPSCGLTWHGVFPPVVLSLWPTADSTEPARFTTISTWAGKNTFCFRGEYSGEKSDQWRRFLRLPALTDQPLEVNLEAGRKRKQAVRPFAEAGWSVADPADLSDLEDYRGYIANSRGEFSVANSRYVQFNTGWFSDRTARYLASGRPAVVQSTGIEAHVPTGVGLLTFDTVEEAAEGIERINADYELHRRRAREIAVEFCGSDAVLGRILHVVGLKN